MEHTDGHFSGHFRRRRGSSGWSSECCEFYSICGEIYLGHNSDYCTTGGKKILNRSLGDDCTCWHHYTRQYFCIGLFGGGKAFPRQLTPQTCSCSTSPKWLVKVCVFIFNLIESKQKLSIWYWLFFTDIRFSASQQYMHVWGWFYRKSWIQSVVISVFVFIFYFWGVGMSFF